MPTSLIRWARHRPRDSHIDRARCCYGRGHWCRQTALSFILHVRSEAPSMSLRHSCVMRPSRFRRGADHGKRRWLIGRNRRTRVTTTSGASRPTAAVVRSYSTRSSISSVSPTLVRTGPSMSFYHRVGSGDLLTKLPTPRSYHQPMARCLPPSGAVAEVRPPYLRRGQVRRARERVGWHPRILRQSRALSQEVGMHAWRLAVSFVLLLGLGPSPAVWAQDGGGGGDGDGGSGSSPYSALSGNDRSAGVNNGNYRDPRLDPYVQAYPRYALPTEDHARPAMRAGHRHRYRRREAPAHRRRHRAGPRHQTRL